MIDETLNMKRLFKETFESYSTYVSNGGNDINEFIIADLRKLGTNATEQEIVGIVEDINETMDRIEQNVKEIAQHKSMGYAVSKWIEDKIDALQTQYAKEDSGEIPQLLDAIISEENNHLLKAFLPLLEGQETKTLDSYKFEDLNRKAVSNKLLEAFRQNTALSLISANSAFTYDEDILNPLKDFVESKINDPADVIVKKVAATAAIKAAKLGYIKPLEGVLASAVTSIVDDALTRMKIGFKISNGEINIPDAVDVLIDRTAARVEAVVSHTCRKAGGFVGERVGQVLGSAFGPAGAAAGGIIGRVVGEYVGYEVGNKINAGIEKVSAAAKQICRDIYGTGKEMVSNAWGRLKGSFSW